MHLSTQPYKGARDFYPEDKRIQKYMFGVMRRVVEKYGYEEYDAPILEPLELYLAKTSEEVVNEQTYVFKDRGDRTVVIRPEMTPSVARMVAAKRQELAYPLRWYSIPNLWRYERPQRGRLREHWQLNVDLFGIEDLKAEEEIISVADGILQAFGASRKSYTVKINSRVLVHLMLANFFNLNDVQISTMTRLIDKMSKLEPVVFAAETDAIFTPSQREMGLSDKLLQLLTIKSLDELPSNVKLHESFAKLSTLLDKLHRGGIVNAVFDITLMRGFDYYTDIVFEVFDNHPDNNRAMYGGGRYDGLVGQFGVEPVPTIGFGMGDVTLRNFLETHDLLPELKSETDLYVVIIGDTYERAKGVVKELRKLGVNVLMDTGERKIDQQIKTAVRKNISYVLFVGEKELEDESYMLKNLRTATEERHSVERIVTLIRDHRNHKNK